MFPFPLQALDRFLLQYNIGQVLLLVFVLALLASLTQRSGKVLAIQTVTFGLLFAIVPSIGGPGHYLYLGLGLLLVAPLLFTTAGR
jgi:ABC-type transport system involved in multi-copper enzyme maturation permease subunit